MIDACPPYWPPQALPYVTSILSNAVTAEGILAHYVKRGSGSAFRTPEDQRLDFLESLKTDWDSRGSPPPTIEAVSSARKWLGPLRTAAVLSGLPWSSPHMSVSEDGEVTFEWWRGDRKITLYFNERAPEFVKVWGPHIFDQMESGELLSSESFSPIWLWLNAA